MKVKIFIYAICLLFCACNFKNNDQAAPKQANSADSSKTIRVAKFEDYVAPIINHKKYPNLDFESNANAKNYRKIISNAYQEETANFAGHYYFLVIGCGSSCQVSFIIDRLNGKIYDAPNSSIGYDFKIDSKLLIVNPPNTYGYDDDCAYCNTLYYLFDEEKKIFNLI